MGFFLIKWIVNTVDEIRQNSQLFDEFLTETKLQQHFCEFSRHILFLTAQTFSNIFLDGVNATQNFERVVTVKHWKLHLSTLPVLVIYIVNVIVNPGHRYLLVPVNTCVSGLVL